MTKKESSLEEAEITGRRSGGAVSTAINGKRSDRKLEPNDGSAEWRNSPKNQRRIEISPQILELGRWIGENNRDDKKREKRVRNHRAAAIDNAGAGESRECEQLMCEREREIADRVRNGERVERRIEEEKGVGSDFCWLGSGSGRIRSQAGLKSWAGAWAKKGAGPRMMFSGPKIN